MAIFLSICFVVLVLKLSAHKSFIKSTKLSEAHSYFTQGSSQECAFLQRTQLRGGCFRNMTCPAAGLRTRNWMFQNVPTFDFFNLPSQNRFGTHQWRPAPRAARRRLSLGVPTPAGWHGFRGNLPGMSLTSPRHSCPFWFPWVFYLNSK